jgi:sensor domain CHASE-containing protein
VVRVLPLQIPGGPELVLILLNLVILAAVVLGILGGISYFFLRMRSGGNVEERLERIERKVGGLEARVEDLDERVSELEE